MKNAIQPSVATIAFILTLLLSLCFAPAVSAQVLLQENFDAADLGTPPPGWNFSGPSSNVDPGQACSGNAFRMNQYNGATINSLDTPDLPRGTTPGNVAVSFDMRLADWNNNSQLSGTGGAYAQLFVNGAFAQDFVASAPVSFTNGCLTQTATFTTADIPLGADFKIRFLGVWGSGDWSYVVDNISIRVVNDECADAVLLPQTAAPAGFLDGNVVDGSLEGATQSQPGCTGNANDDVWYKFVATERSVSLSVESGDVVVELFSGSCGNLTSLRCSDASLTNEIFDYYGTTIGETYYVRVYSFAGTPLIGTDAEFSIQIGTPRSVNDECASAEVITQSSATSCGTNLTMGTVEHATESQEACTGTANDDVWYEFIATSTDFTVYLESGDFVVQLFEGSCGNLVSLACKDGSVSSEILKYENAVVGQTYRFRVYSFGGTAVTGTDAEFGVCVFTTAEAPENNACANATELIVAPEATCGFPISGTTNGATRSEADALCSGISGNASVWYSFTANAAEHFVGLSDVSLQNGNAGDLSSFEVFSGGCGARTRVFCSGQLFGSNHNPQLVSGLVPGNDYLIRVVTVNEINTIDFDICVTTPCPASPSDLLVNNITATTAALSHSYSFGIRRTHVVRLASSGVVVFSQENLQSNANPTGLEPNTDYEYYVLETCDGSQNTIGPITFTTKIQGDECVDAFPLTQSSATSCGTNFTMGTVEGATSSLTGCAGTANDDVWYQFEATSTDFSIFLESGDLVVQLFEGGCNNLTALVCEDRLGINEAFNYAAATVGQTYYLRVYSFGNTPLTGTNAEFGICVFTTPPVPDNDDCVNATNLQVDLSPSCSVPTSGTNSGALLDNDPRCPNINGRSSVWYSFTARAAEHFVELSSISILNGNDLDQASFEVLSGDCGALTQVQCSGQLQGSNPGPVTVGGLTIGQEYLIRVVPFFPSAIIDFDICITTDCPPLATGLSVNPITETTAQLNITNVAGPGRDFIVVPAGFDVTDVANYVSFGTITGNFATATGLTANTDYDFYVQSCNATQTAGPVSFTTCPALATGLAATDITATTASLNIDAIAGVERDFIVVAAGDVPVFGDGSNHVFFRSSEGTIPVIATSLSSNTTYDFYVGQSCPETFAGPITFTTRPSCGDVIYDAGGPDGNYGNDEDYTVTICPETADQTGGARRVSITFDEFDLENGFDGITIYDGEDTNAPVITCPGTGLDLWSWERGRNLGSGDLQGITVFTTNASGCITLRFTSDGSITYQGFKATINCPETSDIFDQILIPVPAGSGAVVADRGYLSLASEYLYYVKDGVGSLLALKLGNTEAQIPFSGVSVVAGSGATNLGLNGCMAPYTNAPDWWVMNRTWDVAPLFDPAIPVEVRFLYTTEDLAAIETASGFTGIAHENLTHYKINGGDEEDLTASGNACHDMVSPANYQEYDPGDYVYMNLSDGASRNGHAAQFMVASFSGGGGGAGTNFTGALPVEFLSFQGEAGPKFNHLNWTTAREENTAAHELERSSDGTNWEVILTLAAAGNSDEAIRYEAIDEQALAFAYYRVRTVDQDGSFTHSEIIDLQRMDTDGTRVGTAFPNPATDQVFLPYFSANEGEKLQLDLLDASGRRLSTQTVNGESGRNEFRVSLQKLPAGLYWLALTTPEGEHHLRRVVKQ
ncbi:T9SS type A sorting domain-containing protein [Neolewinella agarilytica]|uniref:T9SS type A sorting domain-containing protein n=1 Tax=Neolewinella agarilytica TaxID=478744 RepID=UPI0023557E5D|nr:T9SS type A sorting domain-containing protein [Neolewinella agarilytica]